MVTMRRSIIGIMLISESSDLRPPLPPPSTSTPPMLRLQTWRLERRRFELQTAREPEFRRSRLELRLLRTRDGVQPRPGRPPC